MSCDAMHYAVPPAPPAAASAVDDMSSSDFGTRPVVLSFSRSSRFAIVHTNIVGAGTLLVSARRPAG